MNRTGNDQVPRFCGATQAERKGRDSFHKPQAGSGPVAGFLCVLLRDPPDSGSGSEMAQSDEGFISMEVLCGHVLTEHMLSEERGAVCLSGRAALVRPVPLKQELFLESFVSEADNWQSWCQWGPGCRRSGCSRGVLGEAGKGRGG